MSEQNGFLKIQKLNCQNACKFVWKNFQNCMTCNSMSNRDQANNNIQFFGHSINEEKRWPPKDEFLTCCNIFLCFSLKTISLDVCFCKNREKDGYTQKGERNLSFMSIWGMTIEQNVIYLLKSRKIMPLHTYAWAYVRPRYYMLQHCILRKNTLICSDQLPI